MLLTISLDADVFQMEVKPSFAQHVTKRNAKVCCERSAYDSAQTRTSITQVVAEEAVATFKSNLEGISGIPASQQLLVHEGRELQPT